MIKMMLAIVVAVTTLGFPAATPGYAVGHKSLTATLLWTGTLFTSSRRFGPGILIEAGARKLLFDCGRGATQRLF